MTNVLLYVELPFWMMVSNCTVELSVNGYRFFIDIRDDFVELYGDIITDSRYSCLFIGPSKTNVLKPEDIKLIKEGKRQAMNRKCKTVLRISSSCDQDLLTDIRQEGIRRISARLYMRSFIEAHLEVVNKLLQHYRLSTYDLFAYELSPWDVPIWFVGWENYSETIVIQDYANFDNKPIIIKIDGTKQENTLIDPAKLQLAMGTEPSAGEYELMDALNLMERGDYSGAVRRVTTAIEAQMESTLRQELLKTFSSSEVEDRLLASENDFPGRLRQYEKLSGRKLDELFSKELQTIRTIRHSIVHKGYRIPLELREQQAQKAVDFGRWIFFWLENQPSKREPIEKLILKRSLGRHLSIYKAEITPSGVVVHKPGS